MAVYMTAVRIVAMSNPPHPPPAGPDWQARNLPGNDVCHPEPRQEYPASCSLLQLPLLQVFFSYILVLDPLCSPSFLTFTHLDLLFQPVFPIRSLPTS